MSRVIKFRAWWHKKKKMLHEVHDFYDTLGDAEHGNTEEPESSFGCILDNCDKYEVMQFTGLTDRNGVEIYEGDILESEHPVMPYPNKPKLLVEWMNDKNNWNGWNFIPSVIDDFGMTVIGNIYENSELLEAKP